MAPNGEPSSILSSRPNAAYRTSGTSNSPHLLSRGRMVPDGQ